MKRTITIEDTIEERFESLLEDFQAYLEQYVKENECEEPPDYYNELDYCGSVHELVDGSVPIYTSEIKDLWYLYWDEFEEAYENAVAGDNPLENDGMAAIYFYMAQRLYEWYEDEGEDWLREQGLLGDEDEA